MGQFALHKTHFLSTFKAIQELYVALLVVSPEVYSSLRLGFQKHLTQQVVRCFICNHPGIDRRNKLAIGNLTIISKNIDSVVNSVIANLSRRSIVVFDVGMFTLDYLTSYGHITLDIPDPIRTLKSSRVEPT